MRPSVTAALVSLVIKEQRRCGDLRREVRRLRGELAAVSEERDTYARLWMEERKARMDLEQLQGWMEHDA